jgi:hypothetical protein
MTRYPACIARRMLLRYERAMMLSGTNKGALVLFLHIAIVRPLHLRCIQFSSHQKSLDMKKMQLFIIALFLTLASFAADFEEEIRLVAASTDEVEMDYLHFEPVPTTVAIRDAAGVLLFERTRQTPKQLPRKFKMDELKGAQFVVIIENDYKIVEATFSLNKGVVLPADASVRHYKPSIRQQEKSVRINLLNPDENAVRIKILDENGERLVPDIVVKSRFVRRIIDFSRFRDKAVVIVENGKTFVEEFNF